MSSLARAGSHEDGTLAIAGTLGSDTGLDALRNFVVHVDRFLRRVFIYREERDEVLRDVPFMLNDLANLGHMEGDCDDMSIMSASLLCCASVPARLTAIKSLNTDEFDHVFTEAKVNGTWIPVDPTVPYGTRYNVFGFMSEVVC
jgi:transglutaminase-like putative cysteine protease